MKSFLQVMVPIVLLIVGGIIMIIFINPSEDTHRLHIRCNDSNRYRSSYTPLSAKIINFMEDHNECSLEIEIVNISEGFIRINTPALLLLDNQGEIATTPARSFFVEVGQTLTLYSLDQQTKFTLQYN